MGGPLQELHQCNPGASTGEFSTLMILPEYRTMLHPKSTARSVPPISIRKTKPRHKQTLQCVIQVSSLGYIKLQW